MTLPANLPSMLRAAGLKVVEVDGWKSRRRPGGDPDTGVLNHHTGASAKGWTLAKELQYAKWMFLTGRSDLPAPLCQIALGRSGTVYIGAAGRANHAGTAKASGSVAAGNGNGLYYGIEWMLSGTEPIPAEMMAAGLTLNAVLSEKVTGNSVQTISCHYQTSITGKWDIGDPLGVMFRGHRVLNVDKFRTAVQDRMDSLYRPKDAAVAPPVKDKEIDVRAGHFSGQFSDSAAQWEHDLSRVFLKGYDWVTGTEAGEAKQYRVLNAMAKKYGYKVHRDRDVWVGVKKSIIKKGSWRKGSEFVASSAQVHGRGADRVLAWASFVHKKPGVGRIGIIAGHYPTKGRPKAPAGARVNLRWTRLMGRRAGALADVLGKGRALAFYGGDQNIIDKSNDTFFGGNLISSWDELKKWPDTGHGNIDVIARHSKSGRVKAVKARSYTDKQLFLYSDHYLIQTKFRIRIR